MANQSLHQAAGYRPQADGKVVMYSHPAQRVLPTRDPDVVWCYDFKAGLRWRIKPHPLHGRTWVLGSGRGLYCGLRV